MTIAEFDKMDIAKKKELLFNCCGCTAWVKEMLTVFPVEDLIDLLEYAEEKWYDCNPADWLEAFESNPPIGDFEALENRFETISHFTLVEQSGIDRANLKLISDLKDANEQYLEEFGYHFTVDAIGKSGSDMVTILRERLMNDARDELLIAAGEQDKITKSRLRRMFSGEL